MNNRNCLIFALVMLTGCTTMHPGDKNAAQSTAPVAKASTPAQAASAKTKPTRELQVQAPKKPADMQSGQEPTNPDSIATSDMGKSESAAKASSAADTSISSSVPKPSPEEKPVADDSVARNRHEPREMAPTKPAKNTARKSTTVKQHKARARVRPKAQPKPAPKPKAQTAQLAMTGTLQLTASRGQTVTAADYANTVIYFVPDEHRARPRPGKFTVYTNHRDFSPSWLVVPLGSQVTFTNLDSVKHNVFSVTPGSSFDLGYQSANESVTHTFERAGLVLLSCHVHRAMRGDVLVVPSRYATTVRSNGHFEIRNLPGVAGTLYFWNPRTRGSSLKVHAPFAPVQQELVVSRPAVSTKIGIGH